MENLRSAPWASAEAITSRVVPATHACDLGMGPSQVRRTLAT
jgi:hypothetical protein